MTGRRAVPYGGTSPERPQKLHDRSNPRLGSPGRARAPEVHDSCTVTTRTAAPRACDRGAPPSRAPTSSAIRAIPGRPTSGRGMPRGRRLRVAPSIRRRLTFRPVAAPSRPSRRSRVAHPTRGTTAHPTRGTTAHPTRGTTAHPSRRSPAAHQRRPPRRAPSTGPRGPRSPRTTRGTTAHPSVVRSHRAAPSASRRRRRHPPHASRRPRRRPHRRRGRREPVPASA